MNVNNSQDQNAQCCKDFCSASFSEGEQSVVNSYKCDSKKLSAADVWNILKQRKGASIRNYDL